MLRPKEEASKDEENGGLSEHHADCCTEYAHPGKPPPPEYEHPVDCDIDNRACGLRIEDLLGIVPTGKEAVHRVAHHHERRGIAQDLEVDHFESLNFGIMPNQSEQRLGEKSAERDQCT
jgi:hypothetical protein